MYYRSAWTLIATLLDTFIGKLPKTILVIISVFNLDDESDFLLRLLEIAVLRGASKGRFDSFFLGPNFPESKITDLVPSLSSRNINRRTLVGPRDPIATVFGANSSSGLSLRPRDVSLSKSSAPSCSVSLFIDLNRFFGLFVANVFRIEDDVML